MSRGGARPGAGRKKGSLQKRSKAIAEREAASGAILPLEVMLRAMRLHVAAEDWDRAASFAEKAAPFLHPRLATTQHTGAGGGPITMVDLKSLSDEQLEALRPILEQLVADETTGSD